jgi:hypothetical protein
MNDLPSSKMFIRILEEVDVRFVTKCDNDSYFFIRAERLKGFLKTWWQVACGGTRAPCKKDETK